MLFFTYLAKVLGFAFREFAVRIDLTFGLASLATALLLGPEPKPVDQLTTYDVGVYASFALALYLALRLFVAGPYFVWREERQRADALQTTIDAPSHLERQALAQIRAEKRMELVSAIREAHLGAANHDEGRWDKAVERVIILEPQAIVGGKLHEVRAFLSISRKMCDEDPSITYNDLANSCEDLMREVHNL